MLEPVTDCTLSATDFKARCLNVLERVANGELERVVITKRGKPVGVLTPPSDDGAALANLHGFMRGSVTVPKGIDLTEPVIGRFDAETGKLHG